MNNMDYLNQISADNRKVSGISKGPLNLNPKLLFGLLAGAVVIALAMIISSSLSSINNKERELLDQISLRTSNLMETAKQYNSKIKDSELRSLSTSLNAVLLETSQETNSALENEFGAKKGKYLNGKIEDKETAYIEDVNNTLEDARLNGLLDRVFAREISYQTSILASIMSECASRTKKDVVKNNLENSINNLTSISNRMSDYYTSKAK